MRLIKAAKGRGSVGGELPTEIKSSNVQNIGQILNHEISFTELTLIFISLAYGKCPRIEAALSLSQGKDISASETETGSRLYLCRPFPIHDSLLV